MRIVDAEIMELRLPDGSERDRHTYHPDDFCKSPGWYWRPLRRDSIDIGEVVGPFETEADATASAKAAVPSAYGACMLPGDDKPKTAEATCPKCGGMPLSNHPGPDVGLVCCKKCGWEYPYAVGPGETRFPTLHCKAVLVVTDWMAAFEGASGRGPVVSDMDAVEDLSCQLEAALKEDELIRADLLVACERLCAWYQTESKESMIERGPFVAARAAIAKAEAAQ